MNRRIPQEFLEFLSWVEEECIWMFFNSYRVRIYGLVTAYPEGTAPY